MDARSRQNDFFSRTLASFSLTFYEWISLGIVVLDAGSLVLCGSTFLLSWDGVVVELCGGGILCFRGIISGVLVVTRIDR